MFGYLQVDKNELKVKDFEAYKAIYCSLCKQMGKEYTFLSRFILSYDCTFLALLLLSLSDDCPGFKQGRCRCNPLKKCNYCIEGQQQLSAAASVSVITAYYKLLDNIYDGSFFKRICFKTMKPLFNYWRKKASKKFDFADLSVSQMLENQLKAESNKNCSIDEAAEPTAIMLSELLSFFSYKDEDKPILKELGYFLGRWIYLIDGVNDIVKDIKTGNFNPFVNSNKIDDKEYFKAVLNQSLSRAYSAYNLLEPIRFKEILDNIFLYGLTGIQNKILENVKVGECIE